MRCVGLLAVLLTPAGALVAGPKAPLIRRWSLSAQMLLPGAPTSGETVGEKAYSAVSGLAKLSSSGFANLFPSEEEKYDALRDKQVDFSIRRLERDMQLLDDAAGKVPQLSNVELITLGSTVLIAATSPFFLSMKLVEVLVPSMSALSAAVGISAEYTGRVAISRGKEVAAVTLAAAAEAESVLAQAERAKAIVPLCVGIATTCSAFALLAPALLAELGPKLSVQIATEVYLICPLFAVLGAAVAALATQETIGLSARASGIGARRFATSGVVGRTWLSATEQINSNSERSQSKWRSFVLGTLPAPCIGLVVAGSLPFKAIIVAAVAAAQAAYSLAQSEYSLARALEAVATKARSAAVSDTYANQGARAGAILPFTSALSGLCAAVTVAVVEVLPLIGFVPGQALTATVFPAFGALVAAAASISKARCEVDADAANAAATQLAFSEPTDDKGVTRGPLLGVIELVRLTVKNMMPRQSVFKSFKSLWRAIMEAIFGKPAAGAAA